MTRRFQVGSPSAGTRLDLFLASACSDLSRSRIQKLIAEGSVHVGGTRAKRSHALRAGDEVTIEVPEPRTTELEAEDIPLSILYEDSELLAVDKPAGLVVHPAPGHPRGTLVNALLHHVGDLAGSAAACGPVSSTASIGIPPASCSSRRPTEPIRCSRASCASALSGRSTWR